MYHHLLSTSYLSLLNVAMRLPSLLPQQQLHLECWDNEKRQEALQQQSPLEGTLAFSFQGLNLGQCQPTEQPVIWLKHAVHQTHRGRFKERCVNSFSTKIPI